MDRSACRICTDSGRRAQFGYSTLRETNAFHVYYCRRLFEGIVAAARRSTFFPGVIYGHDIGSGYALLQLHGVEEDEIGQTSSLYSNPQLLIKSTADL
jgi:hypothetical protein